MWTGDKSVFLGESFSPEERVQQSTSDNAAGRRKAVGGQIDLPW